MVFDLIHKVLFLPDANFRAVPKLVGRNVHFVVCFCPDVGKVVIFRLFSASEQHNFRDAPIRYFVKEIKKSQVILALIG